MKNAPVSIVITCYNLGEYITEAIDSVLAQTFQDFEVIIIDDGSNDKSTIATLDKISHKKIKIVRTANQGVSKARNTAIRIAKGAFICCLDADDKIHRNYLEKTVPVLVSDAQKNLGFVTTWVQLFGERTEVWKTLGYDPAMLGSINIVHCASVFRKEAWEKAGGYNTDLDGYEDWNFWIGLAEKGYRWEVIPETLFYYRVRPGSKVSHSHKMHDLIYKKIVTNHQSFYRDHYAAILAHKENELLQRDKNIRCLNELVALKDKDIAQKNKTITCLNETIALKEQEIAHNKKENAKLQQMAIRQNQEPQRMCSRLLWRIKKHYLKLISKSG